MSENRCLTIRNEADVINARLLTRQLAKEAGLPIMDQARISLSVSSVAHIIRLGDSYEGQIVIDQVADNNIQDGHRHGVRVVWMVTANCDVNGILRDLDYSTLNTMVHKLDVEASPETGIQITALMWKL